MRIGFKARRERRIDAEAASWTVKKAKGLTPAEQDEYFQWLSKDSRHGERLARYEREWREFDLLAEWRPEHSDEPNPDLLARLRPLPGWTKWGGGMLAAAAAFAALLYVGPFGSLLAPEAEPKPTRVVSSDYVYQELSDGSEIDMKEGAAIKIAYSKEQRLVEVLSGETHFTVAKDPSRPFVVKADQTEVRAIGTAFNVRLDSDSVEVLVTEGRVRFQGKPAARGQEGDDLIMPVFSQDLPSGHLSIVSLQEEAPSMPVVKRLEKEEVRRVMAWKHELLDFDGVPLEEAIVEFNRRNSAELVIKSQELRSLPVIASIRSNNVEGFVRLLELTAGIKADRSRDEVIALTKRN